jgi:hypothetical protein
MAMAPFQFSPFTTTLTKNSILTLSPVDTSALTSPAGELLNSNDCMMDALGQSSCESFYLEPDAEHQLLDNFDRFK